MSAFFASGALLAPKTLQNGKVCPKVKKANLGVLGSKNVPRSLCFKGFGASSGERDFSIFTHFCNPPLFGRKFVFFLGFFALLTFPSKTHTKPMVSQCQKGQKRQATYRTVCAFLQNPYKTNGK